MEAREKIDEFAEINGLKRNQLIGWSIAADFAEWYAEQKALRQPPVIGSLPDANPHTCQKCSWLCNCSNQPCSCCSDNDL